MNTWRYQVFRRTLKEEEKVLPTDKYEYGIHEYYPTAGRDGKGGWTVGPEVRGESLKDVENQLLLMLADLQDHGIRDHDTGEEI